MNHQTKWIQPLVLDIKKRSHIYSEVDNDDNGPISLSLLITSSIISYNTTFYLFL